MRAESSGTGGGIQGARTVREGSARYGLEPLACVAASGPDDRGSGKQAGFDGWTNPLSALRVCQPGGVPHEQHAPTDYGATRRLRHEVGVAAPGCGRLGRRLVPRPQKRHELGARRCQRASVEPPEAHVEVFTFPETPAVPLHIPAEVELGCLRTDGPCGRGSFVQRKFRLLRCDKGRAVLHGIESVRHGTEMAARANQQRRGDGIVDDPSIAIMAEGRRDRYPAEAARRIDSAGSGRTRTSDAETHRTAVLRFNLAIAPQQADLEARDGLEGTPLPVFASVECERLNHLRSNPAGADLVARECRTIHDHDVEAGLRAAARHRSNQRVRRRR